MTLLLELLVVVMQLLSIAVLAYGGVLVIDMRVSRALETPQWQSDRRRTWRLAAA